MVSTIPTDFHSKWPHSAFPPVSATPPSAVVAAPNVDNSISTTVEDTASPVERANAADDSAFPRSLRSFWEAVEDENEWKASREAKIVVSITPPANRSGVTETA